MVMRRGKRRFFAGKSRVSDCDQGVFFLSNGR